MQEQIESEKELVYFSKPLHFCLSLLRQIVQFTPKTEKPWQPAKRPKDPTMSNGTESLGKVVSVGIAEKDLKPEFEKLAMLLSQRASEVIGKIMAKDKRGTDGTELSFAHLNLDPDLPRSFTTPDGRILETTLERAQPCHVMLSTSTSTIIFAPDGFLRDDEAYIRLV